MTGNIGLQLTNFAREHLACLNLNSLVEDVCGLLISATLFIIKIRLGQVSIVVKVFERSRMICILTTIKLC